MAKYILNDAILDDEALYDTVREQCKSQQNERERNMILLILFIISTSIMIIVCTLYIVYMNKRHFEVMEKEKLLMGLSSQSNQQEDASKKIPDCIEQIVTKLIQRKKSYISNYITFQIANKIFGVGSVVYALLNFLSQTFLKESNEYSTWLDPTISFFSIIFVIVALYLSPTSRVSQYIEAWKKCDERISLCIAKCCLYKTWNKIIYTAEETDSIHADTQKLIHKEAEDIASVMIECEKLLSTDSE